MAWTNQGIIRWCSRPRRSRGRRLNVEAEACGGYPAEAWRTYPGNVAATCHSDETLPDFLRLVVVGSKSYGRCKWPLDAKSGGIESSRDRWHGTRVNPVRM